MIEDAINISFIVENSQLKGRFSMIQLEVSSIDLILFGNNNWSIENNDVLFGAVTQQNVLITL